MAMLDLFKGDAFKGVQLVDAVTDTGYVPHELRAMNIFNMEGITTEGVAIERRQTGLELVPVTPRGAPIPQQSHGIRDLVSFKTTRIAQGDRLLASELDFIRHFGAESPDSIMRAQEEIARRLGTGSGDEGILNNIGLTMEKMYLSMVQTGQFIDKDGNVLVDWAQEMRSQDDIINNVPYVIPTETFDFTSLEKGALREKLNKLGRKIVRGSRGKIQNRSSYHVLVGSDFFDALGKNAELREYESRNQQVSYVTGNDPWSTISYAGFTFHEYRGSDDGTIEITADEGHGFPTDSSGIFKHYVSHGEKFSDISTRGREWYIDVTPDTIHDKYVDMEVATYPLLACSTPQVLHKFKLA